MPKQKITQYNNTLAQVYDEATAGAFKWKAPQESNLLILPYAKKGHEVLDIGIGTGQSSEALSRIGCKITGLDISTKMLAVARKKFPEFNLHKADIEGRLPVLAHRKFDIILTIGVLEFVDDIKRVFKKISQFLEPDGLLCFTYEKYLPQSKLQRWRVSDLGKGLTTSASAPSFLVHRYTPIQINNFLKDEDLKILEAKTFEAYLKSKDKIPVYYSIVLAKKQITSK